MASSNQLDLFGTDQPELFDEDAPTVYYHGDPDPVRARLYRLIAEARAAKTLPWDDDSVRLYRKIVPQMVLKRKPGSFASISKRRSGGCWRRRTSPDCDVSNCQARRNGVDALALTSRVRGGSPFARDYRR